MIILIGGLAGVLNSLFMLGLGVVGVFVLPGVIADHIEPPERATDWRIADWNKRTGRSLTSEQARILQLPAPSGAKAMQRRFIRSLSPAELKKRGVIDTSGLGWWL
jgi:hypothetical protein